MAGGVRARPRAGLRRRLWLAVVVVVLAWLAWGWHAGVALLAGTPAQDMDWNADGSVQPGEVWQAMTTVRVRVEREGARECRRYFRAGRESDPVRVVCRTTPGHPAP